MTRVQTEHEGIVISGRTLKWVVGLIGTVVLGCVSLASSAAAWKQGTEDHLKVIDKQLQVQQQEMSIEQRKLDWLISHNKDAQNAPLSWHDDGGSSHLEYPEIAARGQTFAEIPIDIPPLN